MRGSRVRGTKGSSEKSTIEKTEKYLRGLKDEYIN